jgi:hypothetical protein
MHVPGGRRHRSGRTDLGHRHLPPQCRRLVSMRVSQRELRPGTDGRTGGTALRASTSRSRASPAHCSYRSTSTRPPTASAARRRRPGDSVHTPVVAILHRGHIQELISGVNLFVACSVLAGGLPVHGDGTAANGPGGVAAAVVGPGHGQWRDVRIDGCPGAWQPDRLGHRRDRRHWHRRAISVHRGLYAPVALCRPFPSFSEFVLIAGTMEGGARA